MPRSRNITGHTIISGFCIQRLFADRRIDTRTQQSVQKSRFGIDQADFNNIEIQQMLGVVKDILFEQIDSLIDLHLKDLAGCQIRQRHTCFVKRFQPLLFQIGLRCVDKGHNQQFDIAGSVNNR